MPRSLKTPDSGASRQRDDILALIRRHRKVCQSLEAKRLFPDLGTWEYSNETLDGIKTYLRHLDAWILNADDRQAAKAGGLGGRKSAKSKERNI